MDEARTIIPNGTNDLICAVCFADDEAETSPAIGICKVCKCYMCATCTRAHQGAEETRDHQVAFFYCAQKRLINRYVQANSFCLDCGKYLCNKCVVDHTGYRVYRHHTFIGGGNQPLEEPLPLGYRQSPPSRRPGSRPIRDLNNFDDRKSPFMPRARTASPKTLRERVPKDSAYKSMNPIQTSSVMSRTPLRTKSMMASSSRKPETEMPTPNTLHENAQRDKQNINKPITAIQSNSSITRSGTDDKVPTPSNLQETALEYNKYKPKSTAESKPKSPIENKPRNPIENKPRTPIESKPKPLNHAKSKTGNSGLGVRKPASLLSTTLSRKLVNSSIGKSPQEEETKTEVEDGNAKPAKRPKSVKFKDENQPPAAELLGEFAVKSSEDQRPNKIIAMVYLQNESIAMADAANRSIKLFDKHGNYISSLQLEKLPIAMCASGNSNAGFLASSGNQIHEIEVEPDIQVLQSFETRIPRIEGITRWSSGIAAIFRSAKSNQDTKGHWEVHLMSKEGVVKFQVVISTPWEVRLITPIWYISSSDDGNELFISDTFNNRILRIDVINWRVVYVMKGKETGGSPKSIATDSNGNALVVWYDEVRTISPTGEDLGIAVSDIGKNSVIAYNPGTRALAVWSDRKPDTNKFKIYHLA